MPSNIFNALVSSTDKQAVATCTCPRRQRRIFVLKVVACPLHHSCNATISQRVLTAARPPRQQCVLVFVGGDMSLQAAVRPHPPKQRHVPIFAGNDIAYSLATPL
ncbi:hypothetical protein TB2_040270 [Malus domestica]